MSLRARPTRSGRSSSAVALWLAGVFLICFVYFLPRWYDWNQDARLDMTLSIVNAGTIAIDDYQSNTGDDDDFDGHYYSNKAPGQSLLAVPVYAAFRAAASLPSGRNLVNAAESAAAWRIAMQEGEQRFVLKPKLDFALAQYLSSALTVAIPSVLLLLLFFWFLGYFSSSIASRALVTLALGLATPVFPYAQVLYSHIPAALLAFNGFVLVYVLAVGRGRGGISDWLICHPAVASALAGMSLGGAVVFEYSATVIAAAVAVYAIVVLPRRLLPFAALGAVPMLLVVMGYNYTAYHNPFVTGYSGHSVVWKQEGTGIAGFTWPPRLQALWGMSFSPYRGLFFLSPFLLLAVPGYLLLRRVDARTAALLAAVPAAYLVAMAMYWGWFSGWSVGPRYLLPALPFLAVPIVLVVDRLKTWQARAGLSVVILVSLSAVWIETIGSQEYPHTTNGAPLFTYSVPAIAHGDVALNLGTFLLYPVSAGTSVLTIVPLLVLLGCWSALVGLGLVWSAESRGAHGLPRQTWKRDPT